MELSNYRIVDIIVSSNYRIIINRIIELFAEIYLFIVSFHSFLFWLPQYSLDCDSRLASSLVKSGSMGHTILNRDDLIDMV